MSDDAADLDAVEAGVHWYVEGGGGRRFATKGEAIAYAWTLTIPGGIRPNVKMRPDEPVKLVKPLPPPHSFKITVNSDDEDDAVWVSRDDILVTPWHGSPTVTLEVTLPIAHGRSTQDMRDQARDVLQTEANGRGLDLISDVAFEVFLTDPVAGAKIRAWARARPRT